MTSPELAAAQARELIRRAREGIDEAPDEAREALIEAAQLAATSDLAREYATACETLGHIALATDSEELGRNALQSAREAYRADGDPLGEARIAAAFEYLAGPRGFENDDEALTAELALVRALVDHRQAGGSTEPDPGLLAHRTRLELRRRGMGRSGFVPSLLELRRALGLSTTAVAVLMGAAAPALDDDLARALRNAQADLMARAPSAWFLRDLVAPSLSEPIDFAYFNEAGPLRRHALISLHPHPDRPQAAPRHAFVEIDPAITEFLEGRRKLSSSLTDCASLLDPPEDYLEPQDRPADEWDRLREALARDLPRPRMVITGASGAGKKTLAARLASSFGRRALVVRVQELGFDPARIEATCRIAGRDALLLHAILALDFHEGSRPDADPSLLLRSIAAMLERHPRPAFLVARHPDTVRPLVREGAFELHLPALSFDDQIRYFTRALQHHGAAVPPAAILRGSACQAGLTPGAIGSAVAHAVARARLASPGHPAPTPDQLHDAISVQVHNDLSSIAQRVRSPFSWDDLVLPPEIADRLHEMLSYVQHQSRVFETWNFAAKLPYGRGVSALFAGPPGTGKTMAATVIANELGVDLFRIDLSQVVSKYIGETEKNLGRVFDRAGGGQAAILFDEADSLFARRTDVKTSIDRYSNLEVNYLLQRLEAFDGIAILTTNFLKNIDEAFRRRLRFLIEFPFPGLEERESLWRSMIPAEAEVRGEIPFDALAKFELAGGNIKNAVMRAAFSAAAREDAILPYDFVQASLVELEVMGRLTPTLVTILDQLEKPPGFEEAPEVDEPLVDEPPPVEVEVSPEPPQPQIERSQMRPFLPQFPFPKRR